MKTAYITRKDFDKAVAQPWSTRTCLIAQTCKRLNINGMFEIVDTNHQAAVVMDKFDDAYAGRIRTKREQKKLAELRASLPIRIKLP